MGEGIVAALLGQGATVIVPSRSEQRLQALADRLVGHTENLIPVVGDVGDAEGAERVLTEILARVGHLDGAVASIGGWWQGQPLTEIEPEVWQRILNGSLTAHWVAARTFLPVLVQGGSYNLIVGFTGETPIAGAGPISIANAGQLMLKRVLVEETKTTDVRVNDLLLGPVITRDEPNGDPGWITAHGVGEAVERLVRPGSTISGETVRLITATDLATFLDRTS